MSEYAAPPGNAKRLRTLAEQLLALAEVRGDSEHDDAALGALAAVAYEARRARYLPSALFSEPAWDMLLDLYSADFEQREVPTTSLCIASTAASTTALRYIDILERSGLIERRLNPRDNRVTLIRLTCEGRKNMRAYLKAANWAAMIGSDAPGG
ncbi:MAG: MarR family transcriptional regulator [Novosphingobium sp.]|nr:MarR family transcriptional regulator [Novosphingobium sp.]